MEEFFANASVSAFVGAFSAFVLVIITDRRRLYRKRKVLRNVISDSGDHARFKIDSVERNMELVQAGKITAAPIMRFPTETIRALQVEVIDILDANRNQAISALLYWMAAIDDQLDKAVEKAEQIVAHERRDPQCVEKQHLYAEYKEILEESLKNLRSLVQLIAHYVSGQPERIQEFTHE
ncbi:hypothetical protein [Thioalkalivibrio sulfidiphilus]|uniref:hypothetical protein n=1 Tax=Thioalkalivibrio sulfidiphilus TaxID=1033854 RepID=UPI003B38016A